jgi:hypothetical protein
MFSVAMRDEFNNAVLTSPVESFAAHLLATSLPAVHISFVTNELDVIGSFTPYRTTSNASMTFSTLEQGLAATMYSDSSLRTAIRSFEAKSMDLSVDGALFPPQESPLQPRNSYGFRWSGFFKPPQVGIW